MKTSRPTLLALVIVGAAGCAQILGFEEHRLAEVGSGTGGKAGLGGGAGTADAAAAGGTGGRAGSGHGGAAGSQSSSGGASGGSKGTTGGTAGNAVEAGTTGDAGEATSDGGSSGATTGVGGGAGTGATGELTLTIEPNPNSVLSCFVSWKTTAPADSRVQFGIGGYDWEISDAAMVTDHQVLVIGMRPSQMYSIKALSGSASSEGMFQTGVLPAAVPEGTVVINDAAKRAPGWTLMNVHQGGSDNRARSAEPPMAVIYDEEGQPVWYFIDGPGPDIGGAVATQLTDQGVLIGPTWNQQSTTGVPPREVDFAGNVIWECEHAACAPGKNVTHEAVKLPNGHYVILEYVTNGGRQDPVFRELDADSTEVWTLDWADLLPAPSGSTGDWCHGNAISIDIERNEVYANCRWLGLMKTTYTNPTMQWLLPASFGSQGQGDITYIPSYAQYTDSHAPDFHTDDSTVIVYDNGGWSGNVDDTEGYHSRVVEYYLDSTARTATLSWEFPGTFAVSDSWYTTEWYSPFWGDADRVANGNVLIAAGRIGPGTESRVFEVTKADGQIVWELRLPSNHGVYRAERIAPPLVHPIAK